MSSLRPEFADGVNLTAALERRAAVRIPLDTESACQPMKGDKDVFWPAVIKDISTHGLGLVLRRRFEPGTLLTIDLQRRDGSPLRRLMVRTTHLTSLGDREYQVGCAFISRLGDADLKQMLHSLSTTDPADIQTTPLANLIAMADTNPDAE